MRCIADEYSAALFLSSSLGIPTIHSNTYPSIQSLPLIKFTASTAQCLPSLFTDCVPKIRSDCNQKSSSFFSSSYPLRSGLAQPYVREIGEGLGQSYGCSGPSVNPNMESKIQRKRTDRRDINTHTHRTT